MSQFETDGFLSDEALAAESEIIARYQAAFDIAQATNRLTHNILYGADVHNEDQLELLYITLLTKQARSFQGFLLLLKRGVLSPAQILLRNLAESMFIIGALGKDETFGDKYVRSEQISRKKFLEALTRDMRMRGQEVPPETSDVIDQLGEQIKRGRVVAFKTEQIARLAGLSSYYDSLYRLTSLEVHTSPRALEDALFVEDGKVVALKYEPETEGLDMYLHYAISVLLHSLHECAQHFDLPVDPIEALQKTNNEAAEASRARSGCIGG